MRFSQLVVEQPWIKEIDINPLLASPDRLIALDARVILHGPGASEERAAPAGDPALSVAPASIVDRPGRPPVVLRPIRPEDEPLMVAFHGTLSERSVYCATSTR